MQFEFSTAGKIIFGPGTLSEAGPAAASVGRRAFVVSGVDMEMARPVVSVLTSSKVTAVVFKAVGEPTTNMVNEAVEAARGISCDVVVGFGGGSAIDLAKAVSALLTNGGQLLDYLEVVGNGKKLERPSAPCIAIPTTAGTGAEVTKNAVLLSPEHKVKVSLRSPFLLPQVAIIDPQLTYTLPPETTAACGLDALTQLMEAFVTAKANPLTDALCREGMARAARSLKKVFDDGSDAAAREDMCVASHFSGLALANAGLGAVHGIAGPFGGMFSKAPHGAVCGRLLPFVFEVNVKALRERGEDKQTIRKYDEIAAILTGKKTSKAVSAVKWVKKISEAFSLPPLGTYGMTEADVPALMEKSMNASSMKGNPVVLTEDELRGILLQAM